MKTQCQLMAEHTLENHVTHYHGSVSLGPSDLVHLENYKGKSGFFMKKMIINDKMNLNDWRVTWDAILKDGKDFIGAPVVLTPDKDHPPVYKQKDYRIGKYIDVGFDEINHTLWGVAEIFDEKAQKMILNKEAEFGSPTVLIRSPETREQKFKGTPQQQDILHRFKPAHDAIVVDPAFGKNVDHIKAVCTGDGPACALKLLTVSASVQYREKMGETKRKAETPEQAGYVHSIIPRKCGTCEYFKYPSVCTWPLDIPVDAELDYCNHWDPTQKIESDIIYSSAVNSDNVSQLTIVPFVQKKLKDRFTSKQLAEVIGHIKQASEADTSSCVSRKIKIISDEHSNWPHDKIIAVAYSYCEKNSEAKMEDPLIAGLYDQLLKHLK